MDFGILLHILTISGIAIGLGIFFYEYLKSDEDKFDERQLIERGRGASLSMHTAYSYMLCLYVGHAFEILRAEYIVTLAVCGLTVTMLVYDAYCIFHDAFLNREQQWAKEIRRNLPIGALWLALALANIKLDPQEVWLNGALSVMYLGRSVMLLIRERMLRAQERQMDKEEADG